MADDVEFTLPELDGRPRRRKIKKGLQKQEVSHEAAIEYNSYGVPVGNGRNDLKSYIGVIEYNSYGPRLTPKVLDRQFSCHDKVPNKEPPVIRPAKVAKKEPTIIRPAEVAKKEPRVIRPVEVAKKEPRVIRPATKDLNVHVKNTRAAA